MGIEIDPQAVNQLVADAVLKSALGDAVKNAVAKEIANLSRGWDNPLEQVVRSHVAEIAREVLRANHGDAIRERIRQALATKLSDEFIDRVCDSVASKYS